MIHEYFITFCYPTFQHLTLFVLIFQSYLYPYFRIPFSCLSYHHRQSSLVAILALEILVSRGIASVYDSEPRMLYRISHHCQLDRDPSAAHPVFPKSLLFHCRAGSAQQDRDREWPRCTAPSLHRITSARVAFGRRWFSNDDCGRIDGQDQQSASDICSPSSLPSLRKFLNDHMLDDTHLNSSIITTNPAALFTDSLKTPGSLGHPRSKPDQSLKIQPPTIDNWQKECNLPQSKHCRDQERKVTTMDGAADEADEASSAEPSRYASCDNLIVTPARLSKVRFLSDENLRSRCNNASGDDSKPFSQRVPKVFTNPFLSEESPSRKSSSSSDTSAYLRPNAFAGHRDTLARLIDPTTIPEDDESDMISYLTALTRQHSTSGPSQGINVTRAELDVFFPERIVNTVLSYLSFEAYKALRLVCRRWNSSLPQPHFPASYRLPREILKHIYSFLLPCDFDAARHTCRAWFLASLDRKILEPKLRSSGCQMGLAADIFRMKGNVIEKRRSWDSQFGPMQTGCDDIIDKDWICSKRLATESRLSPNWRGSPFSDDYLPASRLSIIEEVDFSNILTSQTSSTRPRFTVSTCGNFVLVTSGGEISVYSLCDSEYSLVPVVRLVTGMDVLDVSMDTSSERFSVAALFTGRIGMLWDLKGSHIQTRYRNNSGEAINLGMQTDIQSSATAQPSRSVAGNLPLRSHEQLPVDAFGYNFGPATLLSTTSSHGWQPSPPSL